MAGKVLAAGMKKAAAALPLLPEGAAAAHALERAEALSAIIELE